MEESSPKMQPASFASALVREEQAGAIDERDEAEVLAMLSGEGVQPPGLGSDGGIPYFRCP